MYITTVSLEPLHEAHQLKYAEVAAYVGSDRIKRADTMLATEVNKEHSSN